MLFKRVKGVFDYEIKPDSIIFRCSGINEDENQVADLLNRFILDLSEGHSIFFHGYRLPQENVAHLIAPDVILETKEVKQDPFNTYFQLAQARINSRHFIDASDCTIYYFDKKIGWSDFLTALYLHEPMQLIEDGGLSAFFTSFDQGADFCFGCKCEASSHYEINSHCEANSHCGYKAKMMLLMSELEGFGYERRET